MAGLYTAVVLWLTLSPGEVDPRYWLSGCLICGAVGVADALKNVAFFVPLGIFLALALPGAWWSVLPAAALSLAVEAAQYFVPGRDASAGDLLFNSLGAAFGVLAVWTASSWVYPIGRTARVLALGWALLVSGLIAAEGWLQHLSVPETAASRQWTPEPGDGPAYAGRVLAARVGGVPLSDDDADDAQPSDSGALAEALGRADPIRFTLVVGPHQPNEAAILRVQDRARQRLLQVGAEGWDMTVGIRTRSSDLRIFEHDQRIRGALAGTAPGDTLEIEIRRSGDAFCASVDGKDAGCAAPPTVGRGWRQLEPRADRVLGRRTLDLLSVLVLALPLGWWWAGWRWQTAAVGLVVGAAVTVPAWTPLGGTRWWEWLGMGLGLALGLALRGAFGSRRA